MEDASSDDDSGFFGGAFDKLAGALGSAAEAAKLALEELADQDPDGDKLTNAEEVRLGTDPLRRDTDKDGLDDGFEAGMGTNPLNPDSDDDGVSDGLETDLLSDPMDSDSPEGFVRSGSEILTTARMAEPVPVDDDPSFFEDPLAAIGNLVDAATGGVAGALVDRIAESDPDADELTTAEEFRHGTDPFKADTDGDLMPDGWEVDEGTNPVHWDTDGDGLSDYTEIQGGKYSPTDSDSNNDGTLDGEDRYAIEIPSSTEDSDGDGIPDDAQEMGRVLNFGAVGDRDQDGLTDVAEAGLGTDPDNRDTDGDKIPDLIEVRLGTDPLAADPLRADSVAGLEEAVEDWGTEFDLTVEPPTKSVLPLTEAQRDYLEGGAKIEDIVTDRREAAEESNQAEAIEVPVVAELANVSGDVGEMSEPAPQVVMEDPVVAVNESPADHFDLIDESMGDLTADFDDLDGD